MRGSWWLGILLLASFNLRFWQLESFAGFDFDQELAVVKATEILNGDLALIGQEVSVGGIFVGPFYNYITAGLLTIFGGDPIIIYLFQVFLGVISTWFIYQISERFKSGSGWVASLLYVFSWRLLYIDRTAAPSNWLPFLTLLSLFFATQKNLKLSFKLLVTCTVVGFASQLHPVGITLIVIPLTLFYQFVILINKKNLTLGLKIVKVIQIIFVVMVSFFVWFLPLLLFDIRNNWLNLRGLLSTSNTVDYPFLFRLVRQMPLTFDTWYTTITFDRQLFLPVIIIIISVIVWRKVKISTLLWLGLFFNPLIFSIYKGGVYDYYLLPSIIFLLLILAIILKQALDTNMFLKVLVSIFFVIFIQNNITTYLNQKNPYSLEVKKKVMEYIKVSAEGEPVVIHLDTDLGQGNGFKYLADYYQIDAIFTHQNPDYIIYVPASRANSGKEFGLIRLVENHQK